MTLTTQRWILFGLGAFLLAGCGGSGSGGGGGDQGAKPPTGAPIFDDLASALERNSHGVDSPTKLSPTKKGDTDGVTRPRPSDLDHSPRRTSVTPLPNPAADIFDTPADVSGIAFGGPGHGGNVEVTPKIDSSDVNQRRNEAGIAIGGAGKGIDGDVAGPVGDPGALSGRASAGALGIGLDDARIGDSDVPVVDTGRLGNSRPGDLAWDGKNGEAQPETRTSLDWLSKHVLPESISVGRRTTIPPTIDPPHEPTRSTLTLTSSKDSFDPWIITRPPGGTPPAEPGPYNAFVSDAYENNSSAIRSGGGSKQGSGEEEPVPEPETVILMLLGLAAIGYFYKR